MENTPSRVLVIDTAWLGDVLFTTALIGAVRQAWPKCELHLMTSPRSEELVTHHPDLNHLWVFDKQRKESGVGSLLSLAKKLNKEKYDFVFCAHPSFRSRLLCSMLNAPIRVGHHGFLESFAFTHTVHNNLGIEPDHVQRRLNLLRAVRSIENTPPLKIGITSAEKEWAQNWLATNTCLGSDLLALIPGSARSTKQWPPQRYCELANFWLSKSENRKALIFLGPKEIRLKSEFETLNNHRTIVVEETLRHGAALLNRCQYAVGNDTGVSFLAIAAGCPKVVVLYGSTQVNYAFPNPHKAIAAGVPCCLSRTGHGESKCKWTTGAPWCMNEISIERVVAELV